jgi:hypothetical protein
VSPPRPPPVPIWGISKEKKRKEKKRKEKK